MAANQPVTLDTLISIKLQVGNENRRFKLPLRDLGPNALPGKLTGFLAVPEGKTVVFERYSDSAGTFVRLDSESQSVYKQLHRAAKAKLKLRIKAILLDVEKETKPHSSTEELSSLPKSQELKEPDESPLLAQKTPMSLELAQEQMRLIKAQIEAQQKLQQAQMKNLEQNTMPKLDRSNIVRPLDDFKMQLMLLDQQNKKRLFMEKERIDREQALEDASKNNELASSEVKHPAFGGPLAQFSVCCNNCNSDIPGAHWHCSICMEGDYDLCPKCVESGEHCHVDHHFLIKRVIENGRVINSTIEKLPYKAARGEVLAEATVEPAKVEQHAEIESEPESKEVPGAYTEVKGEVSGEVCRTCNSCVLVFDESNFVTCKDCDDYDLCFSCHVGMRHGHHPGHSFVPVSETNNMTLKAKSLLPPGRDVRHAAICDGCDKTIVGIRHKCLNCPDWDFCTTCAKSAHVIHPGHRFVPIYARDSVNGPMLPRAIHFGIRCDGPLCKARKYQEFIEGDRYKCAVCDDTDFCANCEALPTNSHNRTHPLIKFRVPVRNCSVTTHEERDSSEPVILGDRLPQTQTESRSTETTPAAASANAATQVQTVAELKPVEIVKEAAKIESDRASPSVQYQASFIRDTVTDGSEVEADTIFKQVWTLRNPGPHTWPVGCGLRFTGGDRMLNIDSTRPASISDLDKALSSNVTDAPIKVNEEASFEVTLRSPVRPGNAISYWRLKSPDGIPFGHKVWCDIKVVPQVTRAPEKVDAETTKEELPKEQAHQSQMIFPTLEKESPQSSIHDASSTVIAPPSVVSPTDPEFLEEVESLGLDDDSTDDGFLTDEEYEILDNESEFSAAHNGRA